LSRVCGTLPGGDVEYCVREIVRGSPLSFVFCRHCCMRVWFDVWGVVGEGLASSALAVMSWAMSIVYGVTC